MVFWGETIEAIPKRNSVFFLSSGAAVTSIANKQTRTAAIHAAK
jgi:hypothetical protein